MSRLIWGVVFGHAEISLIHQIPIARTHFRTKTNEQKYFTRLQRISNCGIVRRNQHPIEDETNEQKLLHKVAKELKLWNSSEQPIKEYAFSLRLGFVDSNSKFTFSVKSSVRAVRYPFSPQVEEEKRSSVSSFRSTRSCKRTTSQN